ASNPGNINEINEGASAAYKDATTMLDGTELYEEGDILQSYTQWYAVRKAAKHLLFAQVNSNTMRNGIDLSDITGTTLDSGRQGQSYNADIAQADLQNAVYSLTAGSALPEGLSLSDTGRISGTPTEAGTFNFTVEIVVDGYINTTATYTLTIDGIFNLEDIDGIEVGGDVNGKIASDEIIVGVTTYRVRVGWSNIDVPVTLIEHNIVSGRLPAGLSLDSDGSITGVPTAQGSYSFVVETRVLAETTHPQQGYISLEYFYKTPLTIEVGAPVTFTVTFDSNFEGSTPVVAVVREGEKATPLASYRAGYVFTGWYADEDCTIEMDFSQAITEDITVYAGWKSLSEMDDAQKSITDDIDDIISGIDDLNEDINDLNTVIDDLNAQLDDSNDKLSVAKTIGIVGTIIGTIGLLSAIAAVILNILKKKRI
ncbi:MAG TPA: putative Ig domain-containing protein, partial [Clostridia bacterium]